MKIGIAGAGTMGSGIAQIFARKGHQVVLVDIKEELLDKSKKLVSIFNDNLIEENLMSPYEIKTTVDNITYSIDKNAFKDADLVIEAIVEKMDIKQEFWKEVEGIVSKDTILATNTSGLSITKIGEKTKKKIDL